MTLRIFYDGPDDDTMQTCEVQDLLPDEEECGEDATYFAEESATGVQTRLCPDHKDAVKAAGLA